MLIQYLLQKLKVADNRAINLNALPGRLATRFDIADLLKIDPIIVKEFFSKLMTESILKFKIDL